MKKFSRALVIFIIVLLSLPALQGLTGVVKMEPLHGVSNEPHLLPLNFENYFDGEFQSSLLQYIDYHFGFRPWVIRLYNQVDYSLFKEPHTLATIIGKEGYLYEKWYVNDYNGLYFIGQENIDSRVSQLTTIRHFLKEYHTELMVLLAPGKGWIYPEYFPDNYKRVGVQTNYQFFADAFNKSDIPLFDVNAWFMQMKDSIAYPLFTKWGTHWSEYGAKIAADSLVRQCEKVLDREMDEPRLTNVEWSTIPRKTDNDLEKLLNLMFPIPKSPMAYQNFVLEGGIPKKDRPSVIVIGDSFYWNMHDGILDSSFRSNQYWYYYNSIFPNYYNPALTVSDIDVFDELAHADLVILIHSTSGMEKMAKRFIADLLPLAQHQLNARRNLLMKEYTHYIRNTKEMMTMITEKALRRKISIDSMIYLDAGFLADKKINTEGQ